MCANVFSPYSLLDSTRESIISKYVFLHKRKKKKISFVTKTRMQENICAMVKVFNATSNNISDISWRSLSVVDETGVP